MKIKKNMISSVLALSVVIGTFTTGSSLATAQEAAAQGPKIQYNDQYDTPSYIVENWAPKSKKGLSKKEIAFAYLGENGQKFKLKGDMNKHFKVTEEQADKKTGTYHFRLIEQYKGIPIFGSDSTIALDKNDNVTSFFGEVVPNLDDKEIYTETAISDKDAIKLAKEAIEKKIGKVDKYDGDVTSEQFIYEFEGKFYNTYLIKASTVEPKVGYWHYFVDATNGKIVDNYNAAQEVTTFGYGVFNNKQMFEAQLIDGVYGMYDSTRGKGVVTNDAKNGNKMVTSSSKMFNQDGAAVDAHANAQKVYDYFLKTFERNSVDDNGQQLISAVHVNTDWNNASWNGRQMSYGDGDGVTYHNFAAGLDVAAHEIAHGVTQHTANLVYRNESGALNESMSDIFAAMVDRDDHEWLIGEKIVKDGRRALRSMSNPAEIVDTRTDSGFSPDHWSKRYIGTLDSGGVHINSSINNKAAYLISEGGKHYGVTVKGVGREATEQIYYRALSKYLTASSNFSMMRQAAIQAATDLYGTNSTAVKAVNAAYDAVGVFENGLSQARYSYKDAIRETVYIQTNLDTNKDGIPDRIAADIIRPKETEDGLVVPVIMIASPYYDNLGRGNESQLKKYKNGKPDSFPLYFDNYFVPRGYAVVQVDMIGTNQSDGCPKTGGTEETEGVVAVIDWLNGRTAGTNKSGNEMKASWSTGKVGMYGKSYDGTLANAVAATGVKGLETIVPVGSISSWYDYYRSNGTVYFTNGPNNLANTVGNALRRAQCTPVREELRVGADDATGNYNDFWDSRDYVKNADKVKASVFMIHGLNDLNVKANNYSQWWEQLAQNKVPRKIWLTQTGHTEPFDYRRDEWVKTIHRWFDYWLLGINNGIMDEPMADIEHDPNVWEKHSSWPDINTKKVTLRLGIGENDTAGSLTTNPAEGKPTISFTNNPLLTETQAVTNQLTKRNDRVVFLSPELTEEVRLSGVPEFEIHGKVSGGEANLTAYLVDYGTGTRVDYGNGEGIQTISTVDCIGDSSDADSACYKRVSVRTKTSAYEVVSRGWMDTKNYNSLRVGEILNPDQTYRFNFKGLPHDYLFKPGHKIGIVITSSTRTNTVAKQKAATIEMDLGKSKIDLPTVGGKGDF